MDDNYKRNAIANILYKYEKIHLNIFRKDNLVIANDIYQKYVNRIIPAIMPENYDKVMETYYCNTLGVDNFSELKALQMLFGLYHGEWPIYPLPKTLPISKERAIVIKDVEDLRLKAKFISNSWNEISESIMWICKQSECKSVGDIKTNFPEIAIVFSSFNEAGTKKKLGALRDNLINDGAYHPKKFKNFLAKASMDGVFSRSLEDF